MKTKLENRNIFFQKVTDFLKFSRNLVRKYFKHQKMKTVDLKILHLNLKI